MKPQTFSPLAAAGGLVAVAVLLSAGGDAGAQVGRLPLIPNILQLQRMRQEMLRQMLEQQGQGLGRGRMGVRVGPPSAAVIDQLDLPRGQGLVVQSVAPDSAADRAGLKPADVILEVAGKPVPSDARQFVQNVSEIKANTPVDVVVLRRGQRETLRGLTLPDAAARQPAGGGEAGSRLGARLEPPGETLTLQLDLPRGQGQVVQMVLPDTAADRAGLKLGDILLEVNGKPVSSDAREFARELGEIKPNTPVDVVVLRRGRRETLKGLSVPEAPARPAQPRPPRPPDGIL
jgi:S1-C subfamily serine protease